MVDKDDGPLEVTVSVIAKRLASCNAAARGRAVRLLMSWLPTVPSFPSESDLLKIWKGLFYAVWHSDKLPAQQALASRLASLLESLDPPYAVRYLDAFLVTVQREWPGIDFLRLDKFYLLIRLFLRRLFAVLHKSEWDIDLSTSMLTTLFARSLLSDEKSVSNGVNYHIAEVFLEELKVFLPIPLECLEVMIRPFVLALERAQDKVLSNKIKGNVFGPLLENGKAFLDMKKGAVVDSGSEVEKLGVVALSLGFSNKFFTSATSSESLQGNRKLLFYLHSSFLKLETFFHKSGIQMSVEMLEKANTTQLSEFSDAGMVEMLLENGEDRVKKPSKMRKKKKKLENGNLSQIPESLEVSVVANSGSDEKVRKLLKKKKKLKLSPKVELSKSKIATNEATDGADEKPLESVNNELNKKKKSKRKHSSKKAFGSTEEQRKAVEDKKSLLLPSSSEGEVAGGNSVDAENSFTCDETVISNLQKHFEMAAAEAGMSKGSTNFSLLETPTSNIAPKKRKRAKSLDGHKLIRRDDGIAKSADAKSAKKVRFSMKNNLVWKPNNGPMPPQSVRIPPSLTPRGSALKKGVLPGPIRETPPTAKKELLTKKKKVQDSAKGTLRASRRHDKVRSLPV